MPEVLGQHRIELASCRRRSSPGSRPATSAAARPTPRAATSGPCRPPAATTAAGRSAADRTGRAASRVSRSPRSGGCTRGVDAQPLAGQRRRATARPAPRISTEPVASTGRPATSTPLTWASTMARGDPATPFAASGRGSPVSVTSAVTSTRAWASWASVRAVRHRQPGRQRRQHQHDAERRQREDGADRASPTGCIAQRAMPISPAMRRHDRGAHRAARQRKRRREPGRPAPDGEPQVMIANAVGRGEGGTIGQGLQHSPTLRRVVSVRPASATCGRTITLWTRSQRTRERTGPVTRRWDAERAGDL